MHMVLVCDNNSFQKNMRKEKKLTSFSFSAFPIAFSDTYPIVWNFLEAVKIPENQGKSKPKLFQMNTKGSMYIGLVCE